MIVSIILRKFGVGYASLLMNACFIFLSAAILFSRNIFRTILARVALATSLLASLAILQYWLESEFIIVPSLFALFFFMLLAFKYVQHKPSGLIVFIPVFGIFLLSVTLSPRNFHNLFRPSSYEDYILLRYRHDQGMLADLLINKYKKINREKADEYLKRAFIEDSLKNLTAALKLYSKSIENNPDNAVAYHRRGFFKLTRLELNPPNVVSALKDFSRAIRLDAGFPDAYYQRSMAFHYLGNKDRAFLDQIKVLQLDSLLPDQQFELKYGRSKKALSIPPDS